MNKLVLDFSHSVGTINPNIYGHFSEHIGGVFYDGLWVGEDSGIENVHGFRKSLVDSFKKIAPPVLRWPGGCFAEIYDWRDGIGPRSQRPTRVNWWYYRDHRLESNQVGTHEFMDLCRLVGAEPYFAANMTTTTPLHIRDWIEYCNFPANSTTLAKERGANGDTEPFNVRYWGIGNENWGGGGQMTPEGCAREYLRYITIMRSLGTANLKFIMCGPDGHNVSWTRRLMQEWRSSPYHLTDTYGMSVHYYTRSSKDYDPAHIDEAEWDLVQFKAAKMKRILEDHRAAMDEFDPDRKIKLIVDEWGIWHRDGTGPSKGYNLFEQQSTMMDAVMAAQTLNLFNNRCDIVDMANVAQLCNNLHSLYLAGGEHFVETPNYHVFDLYKGHQGGRQVNALLTSEVKEKEGFAPLEMVSASASVKENVLTLTLANLDISKSQRVKLSSVEGILQGEAKVRLLHHENVSTCNTFEDPFAIMPRDCTMTVAEGMEITLPAASVMAITLPLAE
ncbi:MAG: alpha-N-arabinofuranosidase [Clostridiales bacterium]|nr:alpha-N-arabinofuranosidase [Clostridiales bacterium]